MNADLALFAVIGSAVTALYALNLLKQVHMRQHYRDRPVTLLYDLAFALPALLALAIGLALTVRYLSAPDTLMITPAEGETPRVNTLTTNAAGAALVLSIFAALLAYANDTLNLTRTLAFGKRP